MSCKKSWQQRLVAKNGVTLTFRALMLRSMALFTFIALVPFAVSTQAQTSGEKTTNSSKINSNYATAEDIAAELRQGYESEGGVGSNKVLDKRLAETIEVWHEPPVENDGPAWSKDFVMKARQAEVASFAKMMPDYKEIGRIAVDGNDIIHDMVITGTYNNKPINVILPCRWTVDKGQITRMGSYMNEDFQTIHNIFMEAGLLTKVLEENNKANQLQLMQEQSRDK